MKIVDSMGRGIDIISTILILYLSLKQTNNVYINIFGLFIILFCITFSHLIRYITNKNLKKEEHDNEQRT